MAAIKYDLTLDRASGNIVLKSATGTHIEWTLKQAIIFQQDFALCLAEARAAVAVADDTKKGSDH